MACCTGCGVRISDTARFCPACGTANAAFTADGKASEAVPNTSHSPEPIQPPPSAAGYPGRTSLLTPAPPVGSGGARWILPIVIVIAVAAIVILRWSQRDGARSIAGRDTAAAAEASRDASPDTEKDDRRASGSPSAAATPDRSVDVAARAAEDLTSDVGSVTTTSAAALDSAFLADSEGAAQRYAGPVEVSGTIATMVTPGPMPALSLEGRNRFNYIVANFPRGYRQRLAALAKGDRITVRCGSVQALGGTTILNGWER